MIKFKEPCMLSPLDDILNVRLQTLGVVEHSFPVVIGGSSYDWKIYDVGGAVSVSLLYFSQFLIQLFFLDPPPLVFHGPVLAMCSVDR